jgi:integrase
MTALRRSERYLKSRQWKRGVGFYWDPPASLKRAGIFKFVTLSSDLGRAVNEASIWNKRLDDYRNRMAKPSGPYLPLVRPMTAAYIARRFEASAKFARYSKSVQYDYMRSYRRTEVHKVDSRAMFGDLKIKQITRQVAYRLYEFFLARHGVTQAQHVVRAWQAAFNYASLVIPRVTDNPFAKMKKVIPRCRRQRWSHEQLEAFAKKADEMGAPSVGLCAMMCMELMQRPGDILNLTWGAYDERRGAWYIRQTKRDVEVWVPPTEKLTAALAPAREQALARAAGGNIAGCLVCPTLRGKRWNKSDLSKKVRVIRRAAGVPEYLQLRDLRRTAATEGASAGATAAEMMAVGGWQNQASIRPYLVQTMEQAVAFQAKRVAYRERAGLCPSHESAHAG